MSCSIERAIYTLPINSWAPGKCFLQALDILGESNRGGLYRVAFPGAASDAHRVDKRG